MRTEPLGAAIVALQHFLMDGARRYPPANPSEALASSATLDYALALAREAAAGMTPDERERAIDDALANAVDDALTLLRRVVAFDKPGCKALVAEHGLGRGMLATLAVLVKRPGVATTERRFALVILGDALG